MEGPRFVHRVDRYDLSIPHAGPRFARATGMLGYALAAAALAGVGLSGSAPAWLAREPLPSAIRLILVLLGGIHAVHGVLLTADQFQRGWTLFWRRTGAYPTLESTGPCRVVQDGGRWGLQISVGGSPVWNELDSPRLWTDLYFPLDEADVAGIARLFDPGEDVAVRWLDLPAGAGGPTLLGLRTAAREERIEPIPTLGDDADSYRQAA